MVSKWFFADLKVRWASVDEARIRNTLLPLQMLNWLESEIGERDKDWGWNLHQFCFKHEEDKVKFILKWL